MAFEIRDHLLPQSYLDSAGVGNCILGAAGNTDFPLSYYSLKFIFSVISWKWLEKAHCV